MKSRVDSPSHAIKVHNSQPHAIADLIFKGE
jgi:hypothetical protein